MHIEIGNQSQFNLLQEYELDAMARKVARVRKMAGRRWLWVGSTVGLIALTLLLGACGPFGLSINLSDVEINNPPDQVVSPTSTDAGLGADSEPDGEATSTVPGLDPIQDIPGQAWMPFGQGLDEARNIITVYPDMVGFETSPADIMVYWDYSGPTGRLAYGSEFWGPARDSYHSVTDLWVYDYATDEAEEWLADNVANASWSPAIPGHWSEQVLAASIFNTAVGRFDLALVHGPNEIEFLATCTSTSFSWSPDGSMLAYAAIPWPNAENVPPECQGVFVVSLKDGSVTQISDTFRSSGGWIGDRPIWADGQDVLLFSEASPESIFWVIPLDGSGAYQITEEATQNLEEDYLPRPQYSLWSENNLSVIGQTEGMYDPFGVWVYRFSEDMRTVVNAYRINWGDVHHDLQLIGWWDPGESVLLRDMTNTSASNPFGVAMVWSLSDRHAFELGFSRPEIEVLLQPQGVQTGIDAVDTIIKTFLEYRYEARVPLVRTLRTACVEAEMAVGPPLCESGQDPGSMVVVFPYRYGRGSRYVTPEELSSFLEFPLAGLYSVRRVPENAFEQDFWPAGEYSVMLVAADGELGVELLIEGENVVRIEFWPITPVEALEGYYGGYILPPITN
jgi:hypothetical protein